MQNDKPSPTEATVLIWNLEGGKPPSFSALPTEAECLAEAERQATELNRTFVVTRGLRHLDTFRVIAIFQGRGSAGEQVPEAWCLNRIKTALLEPPPGWALPIPDMSLTTMVSVCTATVLFQEGEARLTASQLRYLGCKVDADQLDAYDASAAKRGMYQLPSCIRWKRRPEDAFIPPYTGPVDTQ